MPDPADNLRAALSAALPPALTAFLADAAGRAAAQGAPLYLVGGAVRDLMSGRPALDLDLVLAGDMRQLAEELAAAYDLPLTAHPAFGTFTLQLAGALAPPPPASHHIDLITARREEYPHPAALPVVEPGTLADDLARRDFTINALALPLDPPGGPLLDPHGGRADLQAGLIRALHERSFQDDPTRILRAARYAARFGFTLEPQTAAWLRRDMRLIIRLSGERIRNELLRILGEADPAPALAQLEQMGALAQIDPLLHWQATNAADVRRLQQHSDPAAHAPAVPRLAAWLSRWPPPQAARLAGRLRLDKEATTLVRELAVARAALLPALAAPDLPPSAVARLLRPYPTAVLRLLAALLDDPRGAGYITDYLDRGASLAPLLTGTELQALGVPRGPEIGRLLAGLRDARLDGQVRTRADEEAFVRAQIAAESD